MPGRHTGLLLAFVSAAYLLRAATLENDRYRIEVAPDQTITLTSSGIPPQVLAPEFTVLFSSRNPGYGVNHQNYYLAPRTSARWSAYQEDIDSLNRRLATPEWRDTLRADVQVTADAQGRRTWTYRSDAGTILLKVSGAYAQGTTEPLRAGDPVVLHATGTTLEGRTLHWTFAAPPDFELEAFLTLPTGDGDPAITHRLTAARAGYYSVAFTGAPRIPASAVVTIPQECAGRGLRQFDHLVPEAYLRLPRAQLATARWNSALVVDSAEMPFRIPTGENSRFGLTLHRAGGSFQPMAFAPIMGGAESKLSAGDIRTFTLHYILRVGDWKETYRDIAREFYGFRDRRDNSGPGSINQTLERTIDFLVDRRGGNHALWHAEQKYYDYWTDNSGIFKPFSPLFGLSAAIVTDDEAFYRTRALPQVEFALSRAHSPFAPYEVAQNGQVKARNRDLGTSYLGAAQLVSLAAFFEWRVPAIADLARHEGFAENRFPDLLARHALTGHASDLAAARAIADAALKRQQLAGTDDGFMDYLELYEVTREPRYLAAAVEGAYGAATMINLSPATPDRNLTVEQDGRVPVHAHSYGRHPLWGYPPPQPVARPQQNVPAWRVSLTGLQSPAYRGEFWMNQHGQFMRLAGLAHDDFLRDISRWGMVGRFGNYAGDNRSAFSLIAESPDAVEAPTWDWNFATVNPGHAWEFAGELIDFLVSDAFERSDGAIDFPGRPMPGTSFRVRAYGDRPGRFYDNTDVHLWLPRGLVRSNNRQIDYVAAYDAGRLYLAFLNQSFAAESVQIALDPDRVDLAGVTRIRTWIQNRPASDTFLKHGSLSFSVPAKGIVAFALSGAAARTTLQAKLFDPAARPLGAKSFTRVKTPFGHVYARLISAGPGLTTAHVFTDALPESTISATLRFRQGNDPWQQATDAIFPYEFTVPFTEGTGDLKLVFALETAAQKIEAAPVITLHP